LRERTVSKDASSAGYQVCSHAGERDRKIAEVGYLRIRERDAIEEQTHLMPRIKALRELDTFLYAEFEGIGIFNVVFLASV
jgi:hypothetical protein